jgi:hypothetical protein
VILLVGPEWGGAALKAGVPHLRRSQTYLAFFSQPLRAGLTFSNRPSGPLVISSEAAAPESKVAFVYQLY